MVAEIKPLLGVVVLLVLFIDTCLLLLFPSLNGELLEFTCHADESGT